MRRIILWLATTATVLTLLLTYHTSLSSSATSAATVATAPATTGATDPAAATTSGTTGTTSGTGSSGSTSGTGSTGTGSTSGAGSAAAGGTTTATYTGTSVNTRYGPVQVQITVVNGKITKATAIDYPTGNGKDQQINSRAIPILNAAAVSKQSAKLDTVSGATYTSDGYASSLQSAIDQAHL